VTFAVLDRAPSAPTRRAFQDRLGPLTR